MLLNFGALLGATRGDEVVDAFGLAPDGAPWRLLGRLRLHGGRVWLNVTLGDAGCVLLRVEVAS